MVQAHCCQDVATEFPTHHIFDAGLVANKVIDCSSEWRSSLLYAACFEAAAMHGVQVECSLLPELGAKKTESVRGASGPITVQVPLSISVQDAQVPLRASSSVHTDGQSARGAASSNGPTSSMCTANDASSGTVLTSNVALEVSLQQQQLLGRGSRGGSAKRRKRAAEEEDEGGRADEAGPCGVGRARKHYQPDLQLLQDELLR